MGLKHQGALNLKQQKFCDGLLAGLTVTKAYVAAYDSKNERAAESSGSRLLTLPQVKAYIAAVKKAAQDESVKTVLQKRQLLAAVIDDNMGSMKDRLKAVEIDNKMAGHDAPEEVTGTFKIVIGEE